jgi:hypothetical protein
VNLPQWSCDIALLRPLVTSPKLQSNRFDTNDLVLCQGRQTKQMEVGTKRTFLSWANPMSVTRLSKSLNQRPAKEKCVGAFGGRILMRVSFRRLTMFRQKTIQFRTG